MRSQVYVCRFCRVIYNGFESRSDYLSYAVEYLPRTHFNKTGHKLLSSLTVMAFDGIDVNTGVEVSR